MSNWTLAEAFSGLTHEFGTLDAVFAQQGELVSCSPLSEVLRVELDGVRYYVKRYKRAGKALRRWLGRSRSQAEWENLQQFVRWGLATAEIVAYGVEKRLGFFVRGALITREVPQSVDLAALAKTGDSRLRDPKWIAAIGDQLSSAVRTMHDNHFIHVDLKWRNLLVDAQGKVFFIDCPSGGFWYGPLFWRRVIKDLACLDEVAREHLSRTQRLRFYLRYVQRRRMTPRDKKQIRRILAYFRERE